MEGFVKREVLEGLKPSAIAELDLKDPSNLMAPKDVKIGFGARTYLKKLKQNNTASERQILQFHQECAVFLLNTCLKIQERSPLKYPVVQYISCIFPKKIVSEPKTEQTRMSNLLMTLLEKKQIAKAAQKSLENNLVNSAVCTIAPLSQLLMNGILKTHHWIYFTPLS